ncbi:MAG: DNA mismatch repair endonuclease MutL [Sedimentisphaerales bacterium]|nr:DNA mismatch repair endonuclease MutL [Sedimentisphaerales bacterium]MBN2844240.1 DNA mismatch repair endonuclease MutL [Sedimentisphaerales bacterium]
MAKINILSQHLVNKIAAGEVVERPASVVKELMENSLDAGAMRIDVLIEDGGRKLIEVRDDGSGMDSEDLTRCVVPHATSKLANEDDLFNISTMGFRGEAIASIAAISQMEIFSRQRDSIEGNKLIIEGGQVKQQSPAAGPEGTCFIVRNLFFNTPARRKFLKTTNTEISNITEVFTRIALANDGVYFTLTHNGRKLKDLPGGQGLRQRIGALFSSELSDGLIPVSRSDRQIDVSGMICQPQQARSGTQWQYVFVNGRFIRDKFISHAIREGYRSMMEINRQPVVFLFINLPPDMVDVNVHPTKIEVRFVDSNCIHSQVLAAIRDRLLGGAVSVDVKACAFSEAQGDSEAISDKTSDSGYIDRNTSGNDSGGEDISGADKVKKEDTRKALLDFFNNRQNSPKQQQMTFPASLPHAPFSRPVEQSSVCTGTSVESIRPEPYKTCNKDSVINEAGQAEVFIQVHNSFIVRQSNDGIEIIDQHALHERVMYEKLNDRLNAGAIPSQKLLIPEIIDVTPAQMAAIEANMDTIKELGIDLAQFGPGTVAVQAFPQLLDRVNPTEVVIDLLDKLQENSGKISHEQLSHSIMDMMACKAAVKAGDPLSESEIIELLAVRNDLSRNSNCPHGRPTNINISLAELRKMFKRT